MPYAPIFAVCAADEGVTALLGVSPTRLYPFDDAPEGVAKPYAVWQLITGSPENYLAGRPDVDGFTLQVDVYAATGAQARAVTDAISHAIELKAYVVRWGGERKDTETKLYRSSFDIDWLVPR
ncbi:Uncharacterized protein ALO68_03855 [Pseudomonas syringae pv. helianthi]|uniref:HK97 family phage protein n=1 Tax=Pseudomonas syringae pv. helianthi TaxID=251654 RepID=A0A0P9TUZ2_9PSED|nr:DUF3168 domain-containing protein [Pseudomonas syringae group genomosp. 7]KPX44837.1 Uncharacterized protein ALO68_03855 [Pseudomonas syringae pv. helianthi]UNB61844.1 DUF3168 domain-containing protein [Pseudomonas syringae pv. helianthi]